MDVAIFIFIGFLCLVAFLLTMTVRRDFRARDLRRRAQERQPQRPRRKP